MPSHSVTAVDRFLDRLSASLRLGDAVRLTLSSYRGHDASVQKLMVRPVPLRGLPHLSFVWRHDTKDVTQNLPVDEGLQRLTQLLARDFQQALLQTPAESLHLRISKKGQSTLSTRAVADNDLADGASIGASAGHDRVKQRLVDLASPWLVDLGVTDSQHRLIPAMSRKWKQINKFVEVVAHAIASSPLKDRDLIRMVDFGAGKGYLTFAVHDHLRLSLGKEAELTGVELRDDLVSLCNSAAQRHGMSGLSFRTGDVRSHPVGDIDVMIALHACDVATDYAIHTGIRAGAAVIVCSPCCHKQIRPQLLSPHPLRPLLQHGIHLGQQAEMVTDGLRAMLLDAQGYDTQVFEFVALEHTSKNKMILAVKRTAPRDVTQTTLEIAELKAFYGIREHCLETLLASTPFEAVDNR